MSANGENPAEDHRPGRQKRMDRPLTATELRFLEPGDVVWLAFDIERGYRDAYENSKNYLGPEYYWCINHPFLFLRWTTYGDRYAYAEGCPVSLDECGLTRLCH